MRRWPCAVGRSTSAGSGSVGRWPFAGCPPPKEHETHEEDREGREDDVMICPRDWRPESSRSRMRPPSPKIERGAFGALDKPVAWRATLCLIEGAGGAPFHLRSLPFPLPFPADGKRSRKRQTANGKRQTANGKRQTANGKRQTANGKRPTANGPQTDDPARTPSSSRSYPSGMPKKTPRTAEGTPVGKSREEQKLDKMGVHAGQSPAEAQASARAYHAEHDEERARRGERAGEEKPRRDPND